MRHKYIQALLGFVVLLCFSGCAINSIDKNIPPHKQDVMMWVFNADTESEINLEFNKLYPDININIVSIPWAEYDERLMAAIATNTDLPDIVVVESYWWGQWLEHDDLFEDLRTLGINPDDISPTASNVVFNSKDEFVITPVSFWSRGNMVSKGFSPKIF